MKKTLLLLGSAALIAFTGCTNKQQTKPQTPSCQIDGTKAPKWVCMPEDVEGGIVAVGSAPKNAAGDIQFQREEAMAAARDALARRLSVKVKNMFKQFKATTGAGNNQTFEKATQSVSKQLSSKILRNSKQLNMWISPKGTMYVLVGIPNQEELKEEVKNAVKTSLKNDQALYQKFLSKKAQEELDKAIEKEFGGN